MFLFWLAFLLPSIQLENIIIALSMKHYKVSCVSISIIILLSVGLLVERREKGVCKERQETMCQFGSLYCCLNNELVPLVS